MPFKLTNFEKGVLENMSNKQLLEALCRMTFEESYQDLSKREQFYIQTYKIELLKRMNKK